MQKESDENNEYSGRLSLCPRGDGQGDGVMPSSVIYLGMTGTTAEAFYRPQRSTELMTLSQNTSDGSIRLLYVGVQSVGSRIETEAELDS